MIMEFWSCCIYFYYLNLDGWKRNIEAHVLANPFGVLASRTNAHARTHAHTLSLSTRTRAHTPFPPRARRCKPEHPCFHVAFEADLRMVRMTSPKVRYAACQRHKAPAACGNQHVLRGQVQLRCSCGCREGWRGHHRRPLRPVEIPLSNRSSAREH